MLAVELRYDYFLLFVSLDPDACLAELALQLCIGEGFFSLLVLDVVREFLRWIELSPFLFDSLYDLIQRIKDLPLLN